MAQQRLPLIAIVFNDSAYGNVKRIQQNQFGGRTIASDLHNPDLLKLADAYGVRGRRAESPDDLGRELRAAIEAREPTLLEVPVNEMVSIQNRIAGQPLQPL